MNTLHILWMMFGMNTKCNSWMLTQNFFVFLNGKAEYAGFYFPLPILIST